jgi:hypothetical protein
VIPAVAAKHPVVVLTDDILRNLASDPTFQKDFGLPALPKASGGCRPCQQKAQARMLDTAGIKSKILSMSNEQKIAFKNRLNTNRIELRVVEGRQIKKYAF